MALAFLLFAGMVKTGAQTYDAHKWRTIWLELEHRGARKPIRSQSTNQHV